MNPDLPLKPVSFSPPLPFLADASWVGEWRLLVLVHKKNFLKAVQTYAGVLDMLSRRPWWSNVAEAICFLVILANFSLLEEWPYAHTILPPPQITTQLCQEESYPPPPFFGQRD